MTLTEPEIISDFCDLNGEAPVWDSDTGNLYWTDCLGYKFSRLNLQRSESSVVCTGIEVTGFALNQNGGFVVANTKGIWLWDGRDNMQLVAAEVQGEPCQMNDVLADPKGRFLAGSCFYEATRDYRLGCLLCVDTDGRTKILDDGIHLANGIGISPDEKQLYLTDSAVRVIYQYDYDVQMAEVCNRKVLVQVSLNEGIPDGLAIDADGFLWSAQWYGGCVVRYDPDGTVERRLQSPAKQTSSIAFGGPDFTDIFITSAAEHFPSPLTPPGYDGSSGIIGGPLYHCNLEIQGKRQFKADITVVAKP